MNFLERLRSLTMRFKPHNFARFIITCFGRTVKSKGLRKIDSRQSENSNGFSHPFQIHQSSILSKKHVFSTSKNRRNFRLVFLSTLLFFAKNITLVIGDELLKGEVVDTNGPHITKELHNLGVKVKKVCSAPKSKP
jgi:hypothetical protein